jgi:hypothetical protein
MVWHGHTQMTFQCQQTSNMSIGSFFDANNLQIALTYLIKDANGDLTQPELPNAFTSSFEGLFTQIKSPHRDPLPSVTPLSGPDLERKSSTDWQLLDLLKEIKKECDEVNEDVSDYDSQDLLLMDALLCPPKVSTLLQHHVIILKWIVVDLIVILRMMNLTHP